MLFRGNVSDKKLNVSIRKLTSIFDDILEINLAIHALFASIVTIILTIILTFVSNLAIHALFARNIILTNEVLIVSLKKRNGRADISPKSC